MNNTQTVQSTNTNTLQQPSSNLQAPTAPLGADGTLEQQGLAAPTLRVGQNVVTPQGTNQSSTDSSFISPLALLLLFVAFVGALLVVIIRRMPTDVSSSVAVSDAVIPTVKKPATKKKSKATKHRPRKKSQSKK